jgi:hypothetical protein
VRFLQQRGKAAYAAALACFVAALLSKSAAVPLPAVLALIAWGRGLGDAASDGRAASVHPPSAGAEKRAASHVVQASRLHGAAETAAPQKPHGTPAATPPHLDAWRELAAVVPFAAATLAMALLTIHVERTHGREGGFGREIAFTESCVIAGRALWFYPWKFLVPFNLMAIYPRAAVDATRAAQYVSLLAAVVVLAVAWVGRRWFGRWPLVAVVSYAALISPVLSFVDFGFLGHAFVADHFFYLPMLPWAAMLGAALALLARRAASGRPRMTWGAGSFVVLVLGVLTWRQGDLYRDAEAYWSHNLAGNPSPMAYNSLAEVSWSRGDAARTLELVHASIELRDNARARYRLGTVYNALKRYDEALVEFDRALELNRASDRHEEIERNTLFNIGSLYYARKDYARAIEYWEAAQKADPAWSVPGEWLAKLRPR